MILRNITKSELAKILKDHKVWAESDGKAGTQADLSGANLYGADLRGAYLRCAYLYGADLTGAYLTGADLSCANLSYANLEGANLRGTNLSCAYLSGANLSCANLRDANLSCAKLRGANLSSAKLESAKLESAKLESAKLEGTLNIPDFQRCPKIGTQFHAFKKVACSNNSSGYAVLELIIPSDARRVSSTGTKCRAERAVVLKAMDLDGGTELKELDSVFSSMWSPAFTYDIGKEVQPSEPFDDDIRVECASGIHFFMTFDEARDYSL